MQSKFIYYFSQIIFFFRKTPIVFSFSLFLFYTKANCCETLCNFLFITTAALQGLNSDSKTGNLVN